MIKKVTKLIVAFALIIFSTCFVFADEKQPPPPSSKKNGNFTKSKFSKNNAWSKNNKALTPPNPGTGGQGNPIPISGGLSFLIIGSVVYLIKRVHDENE